MIDFKVDEKFENTPISQLTVKEFRGLMESIFAADRLAAEQRKLAQLQSSPLTGRYASGEAFR